MSIKKYFVVGYRLFFSAVVLIAIVSQFVIGTQKANFDPINFFSYFTILSNIFAACLLLYGGFRTLHAVPTSPRYEMLRGAATLYMVLTGIVFSLFLSGYQEILQTTLPWVNTQVHYVMPLIIALDWIVVAPHFQLTFRKSLVWFIFPALYLLYSLIRGPIVNWYPYPFLNPDTMNGYGNIVLFCIGVAIGIMVVTWFIVSIANTLSKRYQTAKKK
jgi:hypothetical protein